MDTIELGNLSLLSFFLFSPLVWFGQHFLEDVMGEEMTDNDLEHMTTYYEVWKQPLLLFREQFEFFFVFYKQTTQKKEQTNHTAKNSKVLLTGTSLTKSALKCVVVITNGSWRVCSLWKKVYR